MLTPEQLDEVYTEACRALTAIGEDKTALFLARLSLVLMREVGSRERVLAAIETAARGIDES